MKIYLVLILISGFLSHLCYNSKYENKKYENLLDLMLTILAIYYVFKI